MYMQGETMLESLILTDIKYLIKIYSLMGKHISKI